VNRDQARAEAIELLARRVTERDRAPRPERADPEPFAQSYLAELTGLGWRFVPEVRPVPLRARRDGAAPATPEQRAGYLAHMRKQIPNTNPDQEKQ
jgi:hypothetical protein